MIWFRGGAVALLCSVLSLGCDDSTTTRVEAPGGPDGPGPSTIEVPTTYTFASRFGDGSSVAHGGQTKRHLLVEEMKRYIGGLDDQSFNPLAEGMVTGALRFFFDFDTEGFASHPLGLTLHLPLKQETFGDLGSLAGLRPKMPDQDLDATTPVIGYGAGDLLATAVAEDLFARLETLMIRRQNGDLPLDPNGAAIDAPWVSEAGVDYQQLIQKYLGGAIFYSQGADDYLDDDLEGKGLLSDNTGPVVKDGVAEPYTALEHAWDEAFGYFGAARDYADYTDEEVAGKGGRPAWQGAHDTDDDGALSLEGEVVLGHAQNAAKRDLDAVVPTDFSGQAFDAFVRGRTLIVNANGALDADTLAALQAERDRIVEAWEAAIGATVVHYINDVLQDMSTFGTGAYDFRAHAKHWSELKGFALALQFNPRHGAWSADALVELHALIGAAPVLPSADAEAVLAYRAALLDARALVGEVQGFAAENLGDEQGEGGW